MRRVVVTGAGGFIGSHLVSFLKARGEWVRGVDIKAPEFGPTDADDFLIADLRRPDACLEALIGAEEVYALAADMGGMGYISSHHSEILHNNALINLHTLAAARDGVARYLYTSSACIYPEHLQTEVDVTPLREEDAYPAAPQDAYGWEKLFTEKACEYYSLEHGLPTRIVRFHNIYGPLGTFEGGRKRHRPRFAGRWRGPPIPARSRSGVTASRPAASATSTTAWRASTASCDRIMPSH